MECVRFRSFEDGWMDLNWRCTLYRNNVTNRSGMTKINFILGDMKCREGGGEICNGILPSRDLSVRRICSNLLI